MRTHWLVVFSSLGNMPLRLESEPTIISSAQHTVPVSCHSKTLLTEDNRFERVACAQKTGFRRREAFHKTDWEAVAKNPDVLGKVVGDWV